MSKTGLKITEAIVGLKEFIVHAGRQPIHIKGDSVIISVEYYQRLKQLEVAELNDEQLRKLAEARIKAAVKVVTSDLPRYIETINGAGVRFRPGFEDIIAKALAAAERAK